MALTGLIPSRTLSKKACEKGYVFLNGKKIKGNKIIRENDEIFLDFPLRKIKIRVLKIPSKGSIPRKERKNYFEILMDERREII